MENAYHTSGGKEYAGTIYSQGKGNGKTFSYNGSFEGVSDIRSDYRQKDIPKGATLEGLIHLHVHGHENDFSKHEHADDVNQYIDENLMGDYPDVDFYLGNPKNELLVRRRKGEDLWSTPGRRGRSVTLATRLNSGVPEINKENIKNWQDADGNTIKQIPEYPKRLMKKH